MPNPSISVLLTYHNEGPWLTECLDSLKRSRAQPTEIVIFDDASTKRPEPFLPSGLPTRVIRSEKNVGPGAGRNALIKAAASDYLHFHDSDDRFLPGWCDRVGEAIAGGVDSIFTEIESFQGDEPPHPDVQGIASLGATAADLVRFCIRGAMLVPSGTHRVSKVRAIGGFRDGLWQSEDWDFHIRLAASGVSFAKITDPLVAIRRHAGSRSQKRVEVWESAAQAAELLSRELPAEFRDELADATARFAHELYLLGERKRAAELARRARSIGSPSFRFLPPLKRKLARVLGQGLFEEVARWYRAARGS